MAVAHFDVWPDLCSPRRTAGSLEAAEDAAGAIRFNSTVVKMAQHVLRAMNVRGTGFNGIHLRYAAGAYAKPVIICVMFKCTKHLFTVLQNECQQRVACHPAYQSPVNTIHNFVLWCVAARRP